jgi:quercetin dioxygenase-like cupin family protein
MRITHVYTGGDSRSHFDDRELRTAAAETAITSVALPATAVVFRAPSDAVTTVSHRPAPRRQLVIVLGGRVEYECGGERRQFGPGDVVLFDDTWGEGHAARVLETPRLAAILPVPGDLDLDTVSDGRRRANGRSGL